jgi:hypothetical protein
MPTETRLEYVRSDGHRVCLIDGATAAVLSDPFGDRVVLLLTRVDTVLIGEKAQVMDDGRLALLPGVIPDSKMQKTVELTAEMRPDSTLTILNHLLETLRRMPNNRKAFYGIPETLPALIQPIMPER